MHVQKLIKLLDESQALVPGDVPALEALVRQYPYCYLAHALLAKISYRQGKHIEDTALQRAATYAPDRTYLRIWLDDKLVLSRVTRSAQTKSMQEEAYATTNNYLKTIEKKSLKKSVNEVSIKQFSIIDTILNKNLHFDPFMGVMPLKEEPSVDLSEKRATFVSNSCATETLASIMVQQKKCRHAIQIYEQLMLQYPEKKKYYVDIISKLNKDL